jgi:hypothetical protein
MDSNQQSPRAPDLQSGVPTDGTYYPKIGTLHKNF